jgi:hypothetical protein
MFKITTHHVSLESNDSIPRYVINGGMDGDQGLGINLSAHVAITL